MCAGDPVVHLCPAGHYCDGIPGSDFTSGAGPRPCPLYTYRASPGAGSKGDCLPCPPGSHCNSTGLGKTQPFTKQPSRPLHYIHKLTCIRKNKSSFVLDCAFYSSNSSTRMVILWHRCDTRLHSTCLHFQVECLQ